VHGNNDTTGAVRGMETITTAPRWKRLGDPLTIVGAVDATRARGLLAGIFPHKPSERPMISFMISVVPP
jgi:hypothetical protein